MAPKRSITRDLPRLSIRAAIALETIDEEKRTVDVVWTTGARVLRGGLFTEPYYEELSLDPKHVRMDRLTSGTAPLLNAHNGYDLSGVIGVVESARLEKGQGVATVRFARAEDSPEADRIFRLVRDGIIRNVSVGYRVDKMQKVEDGENVTPVFRAVDWTPYELSMVPIGADPGAAARSADTNINPCEFIDEENDMADKPKTGAQAGTGTETPKEPERQGLTEQERAAERVAERDRIAAIQRIGLTLRRPDAEVEAAVISGTTVDVFRAAAVDALAAAPPDQGGVIHFDRHDPRIQAGADARDKFARCAEHWIYQRAGVANVLVEHAQKRGEKLVIDPGECRGLTMRELARECLERSGVNTRSMTPEEMVGRAFMQRSANTTGDFPVLLENSLHKALLASFDTTPDTWRRFCATGTVTDFRPHNRYRQGSFGVLALVNENGEFKNAAIADGEKQTISAATYGRILSLSRQAIISDDMSAFSNVATRLGRSAALTIEVGVYAALALNNGNGPTMADGKPLFDASRGNIAAGAALSVASVDADRVAMAKQKEPGNVEFLELKPSVLLLPIGLGGLARVINGAQYDTDRVANGRNQEPNRVLGLYRDIVDTARLEGTTRYSFADPAVAPVIEVAFLNGQQAPFLEMQQGWRVDGVEWKVRLDFGVAAVDFRGVIRNPGA